MRRQLKLCLLFTIVAGAAQARVGESAEITDVRVTTNGENVTIEVNLTSSISPTVSFAKNPDRLIADFPNVSPRQLLEHIPVGKNGVERVRIGLNHASPPVTRVVIDLDTLHPFTLAVSNDRVCVNVLPASPEVETIVASSPTDNASPAPRISEASRDEAATVPEITQPAAAGDTQQRVSLPPRIVFKVKAIATGSVYIDGGSNAGLQEGMRLIVSDPNLASNKGEQPSRAFVAELRIIAVATSSAVAEVRATTRNLRRGDWAVLTPEDAITARKVVTAQALSGFQVKSHSALMPQEQGHRKPQDSFENNESRIRERMGFDYSGITSRGSTPGSSTQVGLSFQSDMTRILGTHWNLQGYWRGRITRHSEF